MARRVKEEPRIDEKLLKGKTIAKVDDRAVNVVGLIFTDGTRVDLEIEAVGPGIYSIITCSCQRAMETG